MSRRWPAAGHDLSDPDRGRSRERLPRLTIEDSSPTGFLEVPKGHNVPHIRASSDSSRQSPPPEASRGNSSNLDADASEIWQAEAPTYTFELVRLIKSLYGQCTDLLDKVIELCEKRRASEPEGSERFSELTSAEDALEDAHFKLRLWAEESNIKDISDVDPEERSAIEFAVTVLRRLDERLIDLKSDLDAGSTFRQAGTEPLHRDADEDTSIGEKVKGVERDLRVLGRLSRAICEVGYPTDEKEVSDHARIKARARSIVAETHKYLGSPESVKKYNINLKFKGAKALEEARANAAEIETDEFNRSHFTDEDAIDAATTYRSPGIGRKEPSGRLDDPPQPQHQQLPPKQNIKYLEGYDPSRQQTIHDFLRSQTADDSSPRYTTRTQHRPRHNVEDRHELPFL